jgi:hypothetical protein
MRRGIWLLAACLTVPLVAACTSILGDFSTAPGGGSDASTSSDTKPTGDAKGAEGGSDANQGGVTAVASGESVYVYQLAAVDGTMSTSTQGTPTYSWTFLSYPPGSKVSTTLLGAGTAKATFVPDVPGDYKLQLVVAAGAHHSMADAKVTAYAAQVFYLQGNATGVDGGLAASASSGAIGFENYYAVDYDGKNARQVICPQPLPVAASLGIIGDLGGVGFDFWEGEAGVPPKFAGFTFEPDDAAAAAGDPYATRLWSGTSNSSCDASPPMSLDVFPYTGINEFFEFGFEPKFSPDGTRIALYDANLNVLTYAADGSEHHIVAPFFQGEPDGSASTLTFDPGAIEPEPPRPQWYTGPSGALNVAWARPTTTGWEIVTAPDMPGATATVYMSCTGVTPREFTFLPTGNVILSYRTTAGGPENLYQLNSSCTAIQTYTNLSSNAASVATDFDISPDGKTIAFLSVDPAVQDAAPLSLTGAGGYLFSAPVDNSSAPKQIGTRPLLYGPRWIGGGTLLVVTRDDGFPTGALPASSVAVIDPDAGVNTTVVAKADGINTTVSTSGNGACSIGGRAVGPGAFSLLSVAAVAHFLRRRKRR